jgi:hypothetical protein
LRGTTVLPLKLARMGHCGHLPPKQAGRLQQPLALGSPAPHQERNQGTHQENNEENFRCGDRSRNKATEAEDRGDDCDNQ